MLSTTRILITIVLVSIVARYEYADTCTGCIYEAVTRPADYRFIFCPDIGANLVNESISKVVGGRTTYAFELHFAYVIVGAVLMSGVYERSQGVGGDEKKCCQKRGEDLGGHVGEGRNFGDLVESRKLICDFVDSCE